MPQAEHMPHVMPRARSSKSSGRVRQIKQRSEQECGCGCWCSGAVWVDGWAAFGIGSRAALSEGIDCAACGDAWMLALRDSVANVAEGVRVAIMPSQLHSCAQLHGPLPNADARPLSTRAV